MTRDARLKWEYEVVEWPSGESGQSLQALANERGRAGWELASVTHVDPFFGSEKYTLFFKRVKE